MGRALGQHLLADQGVLDEFVAQIDPQPGQIFVEPGPGTGRLTEPLLAAGAKVIAIERDPGCVRMLPARMGALAARLVVTSGDAAQDLPVPQRQAWRLAGNIPYQISSPLLINLCGQRPAPQDAHLMVQHEFAQRAAARPGSRVYGRLSVTLQASFQVQYLFSIPSSAFKPPPKVASAAIRLVPLRLTRTPADVAIFSEIVRLAFAQRRKKLGNALATLGPDAAGRHARLRAEQLGVNDYLDLADAIAAARGGS